SVELTRMQNSHTWQANGSISPPACASLNNESNFLINCTAQQDFNGSTIIQTSEQVFRNCTSNETGFGLAWIVIGSFLLATALAVTAAILLIRRRKPPTNREPQEIPDRPAPQISGSETGVQYANLPSKCVPRFVAVVSVSSVESSSSDEESDEGSEGPLLQERLYTLAVGHYESDGSTFVPYNGGQTGADEELMHSQFEQTDLRAEPFNI
uniref:Nephrin n=1 Tax=Macrostomum lignano TaxID=282301 RepID=A0A1I8GBS9_9PLAT